METDVHLRLMVTRGDKKTPSQDPRLAVGGPNVVIVAEHKKADPGVKAGGVSLFTSTVRRRTPWTRSSTATASSTRSWRSSRP